MNCKLLVNLGALSLALMFSAGSYAGNTWGDTNGVYHWATTTSPFTLKVIDSTTSDWDGQRVEMQARWSDSAKLGLATDSANDKGNIRKRCATTAGQLRICNASYGDTGWAGIATVAIDGNGHIVQARAAMNDFYNWYWTAESKNHVMCQEIGHALGLNHTSTNGSSQKTCMDYSDDPLSQSPNQHDYDQLLAIYGHTDSYNSYDNSVSDGGGSDCKSPPGKGCNSTPMGVAAMGVKVSSNSRYELWVAPGKKGGLIINHVYLVQ